MCGIYACISRHTPQQLDTEFQGRLCQRGPDHLGDATASFEVESLGQIYISCTSTVLALRGGKVQPQPFSDSSNRSIFCWNGEAWRFKDETVAGNDGQIIFDALIEASATLEVLDARNAILAVLRSITGPFAFFFFDNIHHEIYFGRDRLGRRSLLYKSTEDLLAVASIAPCPDTDWVEVEADGIYHHELNKTQFPSHTVEDGASQSIFAIAQYTWDEDILVSLSKST